MPRRSTVSWKLSEDSQLGYWFSFHPTLHLVQLRQYHGAFADHFRHVKRARSLLVAHRTPFTLFDWLLHQTERLWHGLQELDVLSECTPHPPCHEHHCTHGPHTRACTLLVELPQRGLELACTSERRARWCGCTARNATSVERREVACPAWSMEQLLGADAQMRAFRTFEWPADCSE